jgi:hypothetical protein
VGLFAQLTPSLEYAAHHRPPRFDDARATFHFITLYCHVFIILFAATAPTPCTTPPRLRYVTNTGFN